MKSYFTLKPEQFSEIEKRGFLIRTLFDGLSIFRNLPFHIILMTIFSGIGYTMGLLLGINFDWWNIEMCMYIASILLYIYIFKQSIIPFILFGKIFYNDKGKLFFAYGGDIEGDGKVKIGDLINGIFNSYFKIRGLYKDISFSDKVGFTFILMCIFGFFLLNPSIYSRIGVNLQIYFMIQLLCILSMYTLGIFSRFILQTLNPLYAFGNIGEKIQKLTPIIESQSKMMQKNFEKDMNFRVLSEGFDTLSSTFSEIVRLVIKLEQGEMKANKGNLFDSEKYIDSLRGDIVEPLQSLKSFLMQQRDKLLESQRELQRVQVRVGGSDELASEGELSSKRSESLLLELDQNIVKLEEMIGKIS